MNKVEGSAWLNPPIRTRVIIKFLRRIQTRTSNCVLFSPYFSHPEPVYILASLRHFSPFVPYLLGRQTPKHDLVLLRRRPRAQAGRVQRVVRLGRRSRADKQVQRRPLPGLPLGAGRQSLRSGELWRSEPSFRGKGTDLLTRFPMVGGDDDAVAAEDEDGMAPDGMAGPDTADFAGQDGMAAGDKAYAADQDRTAAD
jgi:hypothetical protein